MRIRLPSRSFSTTRLLRDVEDGMKKKRPFPRLQGPEVRAAYQWLTSAGEQYRRPTPGRPNYLKAEDGGGRMINARGGNQRGKMGGERGGTQDEGDGVEERVIRMDDGESEMGSEDAAAIDRLQRATKGTVPETQSSHRPFGLNKHFFSEPVLSEELKEAIYWRWYKNKASLHDLSESFRISVERAAAVVRMKQIERNWLKEGKELAPYYNRAVLNMLPQTPYVENRPPVPHESINDLPVHSATTQQIFWPTSESRHFTRIEAGEIFKEGLLPADLRIPHPEMVEKYQGDDSPTKPMRLKIEAKKAARQAYLEMKEKEVKVVHGNKVNFRIENVNVETTGPKGTDRRGIGWRYGIPFEDRKRGLIKIPTSVP